MTMLYEASTSPLNRVVANESGDLIAVTERGAFRKVADLARSGASACTLKEAIEALPAIDLSKLPPTPSWLDMTDEPLEEDVEELIRIASGLTHKFRLVRGMGEASRHASALMDRLIELAKLDGVQDSRIQAQVAEISRQISGLRAASQQLT